MSNELSKLSAPSGANRPRRIKGRGIAGGLGKTAGRGYKGQKARKSGHVRLGFEGGQMPLQRRLPKRGFKNPFTRSLAEVHVGVLNRFAAGSVVDRAVLRSVGLAKGREDGVKLLVGVEPLRVVLSVKVDRISAGARKQIEDLGGKVDLIPDRVKWKRTGTRAERRASKQQKNA